MKCPKAAEWLAAKTLGFLLPNQTKQLEQHLTHCVDCSRLAAKLEESVLALQNVSAFASPDLAPSVLKQASLANRPTSSYWFWWLPALAGALFLGLILTRPLWMISPSYLNSQEVLATYNEDLKNLGFVNDVEEIQLFDYNLLGIPNEVSQYLI